MLARQSWCALFTQPCGLHNTSDLELYPDTILYLLRAGPKLWVTWVVSRAVKRKPGTIRNWYHCCKRLQILIFLIVPLRVATTVKGLSVVQLRTAPVISHHGDHLNCAAEAFRLVTSINWSPYGYGTLRLPRTFYRLFRAIEASL